MTEHSSPYSIRLTLEERKQLREMAQKLNLSDAAFIRLQVFGTPTKQPDRPQSKKELAKLLFVLGQSRYANNLNQLAKAANMGTLIVTPDVKSLLNEMYELLKWIRRTLIKALGLKP